VCGYLSSCASVAPLVDAPAGEEVGLGGFVSARLIHLGSVGVRLQRDVLPPPFQGVADAGPGAVASLVE
jgi:hypothetical protein